MCQMDESSSAPPSHPAETEQIYTYTHCTHSQFVQSREELKDPPVPHGKLTNVLFRGILAAFSYIFCGFPFPLLVCVCSLLGIIESMQLEMEKARWVMQSIRVQPFHHCLEQSSNTHPRRQSFPLRDYSTVY